LFVLKKFSVKRFFDVVVAMEDYPAEKSKPDPFSLNLALRKLGKEKAFYVGDSVDDIKAAKAANMRPIGCIPPRVQMNNLKRLLTKNGAEVVLENINDIADLLL
ncbi:HAD-IA family hydrolase, partial [Candidatus Bathyarchaeota archaeon]|nr:HAD-IA family hydrolase [Candidatus Bathyarchaeota archaeon]